MPADALGPYHYTIDYGDGTAAINDSADDSPVASQYIYTHPATYTPTIAVWNCDMTEAMAVTDTVVVDVSTLVRRTYLPILLKHD